MAQSATPTNTMSASICAKPWCWQGSTVPPGCIVGGSWRRCRRAMMSKVEDFSALDEQAFRARVRRFVEENYPPELRDAPKRLHWHECKDWYMRLAEKGWLAPGWPREFGGMGLSAAQQ